MSGLARSAATGEALKARGIVPVRGALDDRDTLAAARAADVTVNAANAGHRGAAETLLAALAGSGKTLVHTSGSSIVGTRAAGELVEAVFDEATPFSPTPQRAERVAIDQAVRAAAGLRAIVICPSLIYGSGSGLNAASIQVPWLIALAKKAGVAKHIGSGANRWSNVAIDDVASLYVAAIERAPAGAFYFAENGENSMRETCEAISRMLGFGGRTQAMTVAEAAAEWGEGAAQDTMGSNSRVRARRARAELGWRPAGAPLIAEIERGCYAQDEGRVAAGG